MNTATSFKHDNQLDHLKRTIRIQKTTTEQAYRLNKATISSKKTDMKPNVPCFSVFYFRFLT